jgi:dipeptidyl aminopeptidase/acylaminoacyl peptidase
MGQKGANFHLTPNSPPKNNCIMNCKKSIITLALIATGTFLLAQEPTQYMEPPKEILEIVNAPSTPRVFLSPTKTHLLFAYPQEMPEISELAAPELRLAGLRINPNSYGNSRANFYEKMTLRRFNEKNEFPITGTPSGGRVKSIRWSPDGTKLAMVVYLSANIELWVADVNTGKSLQWATNLHDALVDNCIAWLPNSKSILYSSRVLYREPFTEINHIPIGPSVQETKGRAAKIRTFQDLLQNRADENRFEHYASSQLMLASEGKEPSTIGNPDLIESFSISPNGEFILVEQLMRPFSYVVPSNRFPKSIQIWTIDGSLFRQLAETPLAEEIPQGFSAVQKGPRSFGWRSDAPSTVFWVEAQDDGDPKKNAEIRDMVFALEAPFKSKPTPILSLNYRFSGIQWGWNKLAIVYERWWDTRKVISSFFDPSNPNQPKRVVSDRSWQDAYGDPGLPIEETTPTGYSILRTNKSLQKIYLSGQGASPKGNMPFLDEMDIVTLKTKRLWQCQAPYYEQLVAILNSDATQILTSKESPTEQPNYYIRNLKKKSSLQLTTLTHPYPGLQQIQKEIIRYKRADGLELSGTLYLPAGYSKGSKRLPVLMWAYPQEFVDPAMAAQVKESPYRFIRPGRTSPVLWVTRGFAVLDNPGMPIVAKDSLLPNDTFTEQLVANAKAAIDALNEMGVADTQRIAVGGHSYGAFMAANLLAHSDLFAAAIARSGAYNRTLTPFGFQGEERNLWEAPEVYLKMSPFMYANQIDEPILFIHGEADNNSGTFPLQSERLFAAIKGFGGTARLVMLPHESHGYRARQSVLHTLWEMDNWLTKYLGVKE